MADIVKTKNELALVAEFNDNDTRTIKLDNPAATITGAAINDVGDFVRENNILIGDKNGSPFYRFNKATKVTGTTVYLDLTTA